MRADGVKVRLTKVQVLAEFVVEEEDEDELEPGVFGPVKLTAREWAAFDLQATVEAELDKQSQPATLSDSS